MNRIAVKIAYLGAGFSGSQIQPSLRTVEGTVLADLMKVCKMDREALDLRFSSRTDRGVNALGNAICFNSEFQDVTILLRALNSVSDGVFYRSACIVEPGFNPRHASRRLYRYVLPSDRMDIDLARECASLFVGEHDFIRFCKTDGKPTTLTIDSIDVRREGDTIILEFNALYYLWNMIRRLSSAIHEVSTGHMTLDDVRRALDGEVVNFGMGRPDALTLVDVQYDGLTFVPGEPRFYSNRSADGIFEADLKRGFYSSL